MRRSRIIVKRRILLMRFEVGSIDLGSETRSIGWCAPVLLIYGSAEEEGRLLLC